MSAISRKSLTLLRSYSRTSSEKTRTLAAWSMASQAFRSELQLSWKSFLKCLIKRDRRMQRTKAARILMVAWSFELLALGQVNGKEPTMAHPTFYRAIKIDGLS